MDTFDIISPPPPTKYMHDLQFKSVDFEKIGADQRFSHVK